MSGPHHHYGREHPLEPVQPALYAPQIVILGIPTMKDHVRDSGFFTEALATRDPELNHLMPAAT